MVACIELKKMKKEEEENKGGEGDESKHKMQKEDAKGHDESISSALHDLVQDRASPIDLDFGQSGVHQEHQACFPKLFRHGEPFGRAPTGIVESLFEVNLRTRPSIARYAIRVDFMKDSIAIPSGPQLLWFY